MVKLLHRKSHSSEEEVAALLAQETGDPAFHLKTKWIEAYGRKDYAGALQQVEKALELTPDAPAYLALRAMTHVQLGNRTPASADVAKALAIDPTHADVRNVQKALRAFGAESRDKARELAAGGDDAAAITEMTHAVEIEPDNATNWFMRAVFEAHAEDRIAAMADLRATLELDPNHEQARGLLTTLEPSTTAEPSTTEAWHCYVCSGNPSLIDAFRDLFADAGVSGLRRAFIANGTLADGRPKAREAGISFAGAKHMGTSSEPVDELDAVLSSMSMQGTEGVHIVALNVDAARKGAVLKVYEELLGSAMQQGILPFPLFTTTNEDAARFLDELLG